MRKTLTTCFALAVGLVPHISHAQTSEPPLEEIVVTGEFAGPGMWQIMHPDHPGHTLWIVGEPPLLPNRMQWRSQKVERVASQSQEVLLQPGLGLKPDKEVGLFRMLTLAPAALKVRKNPDKAKLEDLLPPDVYARWLVQKKLYLGRDSGVEKMRPLFVADKLREAAIEKLQLRGGGSAWMAIERFVNEKKIPVTRPNLEFTFETDELRAKLKALSHESFADVECFTQAVALTEALSNQEVERARARAWATGDLAALEALPPLPDPDIPCFTAITSIQAVSEAVPANVREQMDETWFAAAAKALTKNESTIAFVQLSDLLGDRGYLDGLRKRGYAVLAPGIENP